MGRNSVALACLILVGVMCAGCAAPLPTAPQNEDPASNSSPGDGPAGCWASPGAQCRLVGTTAVDPDGNDFDTAGRVA